MSESILALRAKGAPQFVTIDADKLLAVAVKAFEEETGRQLAPAQVENYVLEVCAYMMAIHAAEVQLALEQNLLAWSRAARIDAIGAERDTPRLPAERARGRVTLILDPALPLRTVEAGSRVQFAGRPGIVFELAEDLVAGNGRGSAEVYIVAALTGAAANGIASGTVGSMIDAVPEILTVTLTEGTAGGADEEADEPYIVRVAGAWERISRGGNAEANRVVALGYSADVIDVHVVRNADRELDFTFLMADGAPDASEVEAIEAYLMDGRLPQGETAHVFAPALDSREIDLNLAVTRAAAEAEAVIAVEAVLAIWRASLGGSIVPTEITTAAASVAGVVDASLPGVTYDAVAPNAVRDVTLGTVTVTLVSGD